ncbi:MAG: hypothetical protein M1833_001044 [Piccolia ochrophora]|nr:MAG: hypothetical protein M1833_001044 [Piccolia ochrophora]
MPLRRVASCKDLHSADLSRRPPSKSRSRTVKAEGYRGKLQVKTDEMVLRIATSLAKRRGGLPTTSCSTPFLGRGPPPDAVSSKPPQRVDAKRGARRSTRPEGSSRRQPEDQSRKKPVGPSFSKRMQGAVASGKEAFAAGTGAVVQANVSWARHRDARVMPSPSLGRSRRSISPPEYEPYRPGRELQLVSRHSPKSPFRNLPAPEVAPISSQRMQRLIFLENERLRLRAGLKATTKAEKALQQKVEELERHASRQAELIHPLKQLIHSTQQQTKGLTFCRTQEANAILDLRRQNFELGRKVDELERRNEILTRDVASSKQDIWIKLAESSEEPDATLQGRRLQKRHLRPLE